MKRFFVILLLALPLIAFSQKKQTIDLWPGRVPGESKEKAASVLAPSRNDNVIRIAEITNPIIEVWPAGNSKNTGKSVVVCPGGGYSILAWDKEGTEIASWLNSIGITAFVLQYRVPDKKAGALQDAQRALRIIRSRAAEWSVDPEKIGIMGFSAGGSLSARASTMFREKTYSPIDKVDSLSCRPAFTILIYPAYLDQGPGNTITEELKLSKDVPPFFIFQTIDDTYGNSALVMAQALRNAKLPVEIHMLPSGGHGYGLRPGSTATVTWPALAEKWLNQLYPENK